MLTNITQRNGEYGWKVNLDSFMDNVDGIIGFPQYQTQFDGPTIFIGGSLSNHIR